MNSFINRSARPPLISPGAIKEEVTAASTGLSVGSPQTVESHVHMFCVVMFGCRWRCVCVRSMPAVIGGLSHSAHQTYAVKKAVIVTRAAVIVDIMLLPPPTFPAEELNTGEEMERFHVTPVTSSWMKIALPRNVSSSCATTELLNRCTSRTRCRDSARGGGPDFLFTVHLLRLWSGLIMWRAASSGNIHASPLERP